jgi:hypothetical protein
MPAVLQACSESQVKFLTNINKPNFRIYIMFNIFCFYYKLNIIYFRNQIFYNFNIKIFFFIYINIYIFIFFKIL